VIEAVDPISLPLWLIAAFAAAQYPLGLMIGAECSLCCCRLCNVEEGECCGNEWPRAVGECCDNEWRMDEGVCCGDQWETGEGECCGDEWQTGEGECCDDQWQTGEGVCCNVKTVYLEFSATFGDGATGKIIQRGLEGELEQFLQLGGSGYATVVNDEVQVAEVTVIVDPIFINPNTATQPTLSATVDDNADSPTFGQITEITIDDPGDNYENWDWQLARHWFDSEEDGHCCKNLWYPTEGGCPEGQVFMAKEGVPDCCGCLPDEIYDPETQQMVPTVDNEDLLACDCSRYYTPFTVEGEDRGTIGACCYEDHTCAETFEDECDGEWEQRCCEPDGCLAPCCVEDTDGVVSCDIRLSGQCVYVAFDAGTVGEGEDCETSCKGTCCVDGVPTPTLLSQEECDEAGGCWAGVGSTECLAPTSCRPPFDASCCESVVSGASGLTFTQPRRKRCAADSNTTWMVTVTGTTDSEIKIHGVPFGQDATPAKRCPFNVSFLVCWDKFNIEPMPCNTEFRRLDATVCWGESGGTLETLAYSGCTDISLWLGECNRDCATVLTYGGVGVTYNGTVEIRGDAELQANGTGPLVFTAFTYPNACDLKLTLSGTSDLDNAIPALSNPSAGTKLELVKADPGRWLLTGASTHTGQTSLVGGTIVAKVNSPLDGNGAFGFSINGGLGGGSSPVVKLGGPIATTLLLDNGAQVGRLIEIPATATTVFIGGLNSGGTTRFQSAMTFFVNRDVTLYAETNGEIEFANGWIGGEVGNGAPLEASFAIGTEQNLGVVLLSGNLSTTGSVAVLHGTLRATSSLTAGSVIVNGENAVLSLELLTPLTSPLLLSTGVLTGNCEISGDVTMVNAGAIIVAFGSELLMSGTVAGDGTIDKLGSGTLRVTATNTFTGTLNVLEGVLSGDSEFSGYVYLSDGTEVYTQAGDELIIAGTLDGGGSATKAGPGRLTIAGTYAFLGELLLSEGSLAGDCVVLGTVTASDGTEVFADENNELRIAGVLDGTGTLTKSGLGRLALTGDNPFDGTLSITEGELSGVGVFAAEIELSNGTKISAYDQGDFDITGTLSGSGTVETAGSGEIRLFGQNNFFGTFDIQAGSLTVMQIPFNPGSLATKATFTPTGLTVFFAGAPATGDTYILLGGPTEQDYGGAVTLIGTSKTATYNAATATVTIN
jgi:autotransporter-associated beta strand protein